jgi:CheY-like chemotaxis protein
MMKVLCVDDNPDMLLLSEVALSRSGWSVLLAKNGLEGMELFLANPDLRLVVTDINMPKMDGNQMARRIRRAGRAGVLIVAITGGLESEIEAPLFDQVLRKPFKIAELDRLLKLHAERYEAGSHGCRPEARALASAADH